MDYNTITIKKSEISSLWKKHCSKFISEKEAHVQRLAFVLAHYQMWIRRAAEKTLNTETEVTCIQEMMNLLGNYGRPQMMDDYYAIKAMIEMENQENEDQKTEESNNNKENAEEHEIRQHFKSTVGQCKNFSNCNSFVRNRRPRSSDDNTNERREAFYIRAEDVEKYGNAGFSRFEVREVMLQSSIDIIHNFIFHAKDEELNVDKSHFSKFVTDVEMEGNESKSNNNNSQQKIKKMGQYSFGIFTTYWRKNYWAYVSAKYPDLKTELIENSFNSISVLSYEALEENARDILKTKYGKSLKCKREHAWMKVDGKQLIPKGSLITEKHLVAVLAYTNHGKMQYEFKKHGFRKINSNESENDVRKRTSEIAHWSRAIFEVIHCWGSVMNRKKPLFHGISCKLVFDRYATTFNMPTSLTTNVRIAQNFATENGIILVLKHARENDDLSLMFDVSRMSDFPNEEERLIMKTKAQVFDILMDGPSVKQWLRVLRIYEKIRMGHFLSHVSFSDAQQEMIVHMIDNYLAEKETKNENVPKYIQQCFNECTDVGGMHINSHEIKHAISNEQLLQYLDTSQNGKNSKFLSIKTVSEVYVYDWRVTGDAYDLYFSDSHPAVVDQRIYRINLRKDDDEPLYLKFHWKLYFNSNGNDGLLMCVLFCDHLPAGVAEVFMNLGIFIKETKSETYIGANLNRQQMYASVLHSVVDSNKLLVENNSGMKESEFNIKLLFALRYCIFS